MRKRDLLARIEQLERKVAELEARPRLPVVQASAGPPVWPPRSHPGVPIEWPPYYPKIVSGSDATGFSIVGTQ